VKLFLHDLYNYLWFLQILIFVQANKLTWFMVNYSIPFSKFIFLSLAFKVDLSVKILPIEKNVLCTY
jgi:hypothetical protein